MKGEYYESIQKKYELINNSNNLIKDEITIRPISASIKRPDIFKFNKTAVKIQKTEFPSLLNQITQSSQMSDLQKAKSISKNVEKERLYDDNINLKSVINNLRKENSILKAQVGNLEIEMNRKDKAIEDMNVDMHSGHFNRGNLENIVMTKGKETSLFMNLKKQIKEIEKEIKLKSNEHEFLKKNMKITKMNELNVDINILNEEIIKVRRFLEISVKSNQEKEKYLNDFMLLKDLFLKQQNQLVILDDKNIKLDQEIKSKEEELEIMKSGIKDKDSKIIKLTKEFKQQLELNEKLDKETLQNDFTSIQSKLSSFESKIATLKKEIGFFKSESDKKDKKYKELEKIAKGKIDFNSNYNNNTNFKDSIKFSQSTYQEPSSYISGEELKIRFQKLAKEKEELEILNKKLTEKLNFHENKQDISNHMNSNQNNINNNELKTNELVASNNNIGGGNEENKDYQNDNQDNEVIDEEELKNYLYNEDQFKEFTYILIKNFEAQKLESVKLTKIFNEVDQNTDEIILSDLATKIAEALGIKNNIDQTKILIYINTLLIYSGSEYENFKQKFFTLFDSVSSFSINQQEEYKKKLIKKLSKYIDQLNDSIKSFDQNNSGFITFQQLRKILDTININLDDELVEYLIYLMKCFINDENTNLEDLKYSNIVSLIPKNIQKIDDESPNKHSQIIHSEGGKSNNIVLFEDDKISSENNKFDEKDTNNKGSGIDLNMENNNNEVGLKNEDSEVVITTNQFNKIIEGIFMKIAEHLLTSKSTARTHFKDIIYSHEFNNEVYEAIPLQYLLDNLEKINIKIDTIGIHCLYEKLKYSDDFESIDVAKLVEELENYGIFEKNNSTSNQNISNPENVDDFIHNLANFLKDKELQLVDLLKSHMGVKMDGEMLTKKMLIKIKDLEEIMYENNILKGKNSFKMLMKEFFASENNNYISVSKLMLKLENIMNKGNEEEQNLKENSKFKNRTENQPENPNNIDKNNTNKTNESKKSVKDRKENKEMSLSNDIPEADSRLLNETLNGLKQKEEEEKQEDNSLLELEKELEDEDNKKENDTEEKKTTKKE